MKGAQHSAKNTAKNISLIVLVVMLGVLCAANWLAGMNIAQMPADNLLRRAYDHLFGGAVGYELRSSGVSAAEPAQLALTVDGQLYGVQYNMTDIDAGLAVRSGRRRFRTARCPKAASRSCSRRSARATARCCAITGPSR